MSAKHPLSYARALGLAEDVVAVLRPACERIEIAGSLRRHKADVGDIELVAIPKTQAITDLFGIETGHLSLVDMVVAAQGLALTKNGDKYKQFTSGGMTVDLFLPTSETWGMVYTIRTGSADFTHWLVTNRYAGGALPNHMKAKDGRLWQQGRVLDTPEEADVFRVIGLEWVPPEQRGAGRWPR